MTKAKHEDAEGDARSPREIAAAMREVEGGLSVTDAARSLGLVKSEYQRLAAAHAERRKAKLVTQLPLVFHEPDPDAEKAIREDVSAIAAIAEGESLFIGADEGAALERLTARRDAAGRVVGYGGHKRFDLHDFFDFPNGRDEEADVEGLAIADGFLWVVGSHSLKRKKPKAGDDPEKALETLTRVVREANRFLLCRIPLVAGDHPGAPKLAASGPAVDGSGRTRRAGALRMDKDGSVLSRRLARDPHLGPFMSIPSKDNGLDVEGMAVSGDRVFLGLRGPVLRGWATILELRFRAKKKTGRLKLRRQDDGDLIRRHFLDLDGLGVRSLLIDGEDLVVLAGPTMDLDGPVRLYRWRGGLNAQDSTVAPRADVERILDLPFGEGDDHAEGATLMPLSPGDPIRLVVAYDTPAHARLVRSGGVLADVFEAPERF
ncbi:DUF3616 domain-containing protein [Chenggangzhangella methanolivorans]|uniref:DUF3616 domain-containing protein n=1 Tax=Chenggangzhangella methanolivorans TaxID=1437009 RepID=A0A9E6ULD2_9HYPH|nr:DUF3616 domain-containing protein [Chenggangzhangella methanolivorans]QZO00407.1 DUF3616 domain-containing protein [Chenggangzhangella methanolivorans]